MRRPVAPSRGSVNKGFAKPQARQARWLVVMLKTPVAGRVKTRLARGIGFAAATSFYRHATSALLARIDNPAAWSTVIAVTPDPELRSPALPRGFLRMTQGRGDLGQRLQRIMDTLPCGPVLVIGSDVPGITRTHIAEAFRSIAGAEAVIGPSPDGGYWLMGLRRRPRRLTPFGHVRWSSAHARADTLRNLGGLHVRLVAELDDVDDAGDYSRHADRSGRRILAPTRLAAYNVRPKTALTPQSAPRFQSQ